jgi:hypothetical protein
MTGDPKDEDGEIESRTDWLAIESAAGLATAYDAAGDALRHIADSYSDPGIRQACRELAAIAEERATIIRGRANGS